MESRPPGTPRPAARSHSHESGSLENAAFEPYADVDIHQPIFTRFERICARYTDKIAVDDGNLRLTYLELLRAAKRLAVRINAAVPVAQPAGTVGILLPNNALFPVAALACLAAGRVYVPIDRDYPLERNRQIAEEAGLAAVVCEIARDNETFPFLSVPRIDMDIAGSLGPGDTGTTTAAPADEPAIVIYTSGSTGRPKGICNHQSAISQRVAHFTNTCELSARDRLLLLSSPGAIAGVRDTFAALLNGATLHIADPHRLGINGVLRALLEQKITVCYAVPALARELLRLPEAMQACADMRIFRLGGDAVLPDGIALCRATLPRSCRILIGYGSTEAPTLFQWFVPHDWQPAGARVPSGYAAPDIDIALQTESGAAAAPGEIAEVVVTSRYIALGLWQHGQLQAATFPTDPANPAARILHTGDLVRQRGDGLVELTGRKDRQIKIKGYRIDPGDVEAALRACDGVAQAVVTSSLSLIHDNDALVAYVVPRTSVASLNIGHLREAVKTLPRHMWPVHFHLIDAIPRLPSFKPDIAALQRTADGNMATANLEARPVTAPLTETESETETAVLTIWRRLLKDERLGVTDNFFEAGGDSLLAMKAACEMELELQLGFAINLETLYHWPTVKTFVDNLASSQSGENKAAAILPINDRAAQAALYFTHSGFDFAPLGKMLTSELFIAFVTLSSDQWIQTLVGGKKALDAIDQVSRVYAEAIYARGRNGPCYLAGHSFGGILAIETACKLQALGLTPHTVFLFDTYMHGPLHRILYDIRHNGWLARKVKQVLRGNIDDMSRRSRFLAQAALSRVTGRITGTAAARKVDSEPAGGASNALRDLREETSLAYRKPSQTLNSQVVLFRATQSITDRTLKHDPDPGWAHHLEAKLKIIQTPGDHYNLMDAGHGSFVAAEMDRIMNE